MVVDFCSDCSFVFCLFDRAEKLFYPSVGYWIWAKKFFRSYGGTSEKILSYVFYCVVDSGYLEKDQSIGEKANDFFNSFHISFIVAKLL